MTMTRFSARRTRVETSTITMALALATALVVGCGGGDKGTGPGPGPSPEVVATVDVSAPVTTLAPAQTVQLVAVARNGSGAPIGSVAPAWTTSAAAVATVSASGLVTAVAAGNAVIRATADGKFGTVSVTVTSGSGTLASVVVTSQDNVIELGGGTQAMVSARDASGATIALGNRTVAWTTSNPLIATITSGGFATGVGIGTVNLQVSVQDGATVRTGTVPMTVTGVPGAPTSATVEMLPDRFLPYEIVLRQNGSVNFNFPTLAHNVIWERVRPGAPTDIAATSSMVLVRSFPTVGVFDYVCTLHTGMIGKIIVTP
ncbi:MAG TPA: Ig-like domain-containing protein [Gemmatimonas sp.]|nr:Ig-like domain-containing protein [Gemmatimonas sp.]